MGTPGATKQLPEILIIIGSRRCFFRFCSQKKKNAEEATQSSSRTIASDTWRKTWARPCSTLVLSPLFREEKWREIWQGQSTLVWTSWRAWRQSCSSLPFPLCHPSAKTKSREGRYFRMAPSTCRRCRVLRWIKRATGTLLGDAEFPPLGKRLTSLGCRDGHCSWGTTA